MKLYALILYNFTATSHQCHSKQCRYFDGYTCVQLGDSLNGDFQVSSRIIILTTEFTDGPWFVYGQQSECGIQGRSERCNVQDNSE